MSENIESNTPKAADAAIEKGPNVVLGVTPPPMPQYDASYAYAYAQHERLRKDVKRELQKEEDEKRKLKEREGSAVPIIIGLVLACLGFFVVCLTLSFEPHDIVIFCVSFLTMGMGIAGITLSALKIKRRFGMALPAVIIGSLGTFISFISVCISAAML